jgi:DNA-binding MarR family transcriptional regulator
MHFYMNSKFLKDNKLQSLPGENFTDLIELWCVQAQSGHGIKTKLPPSEEIAFILRISTQEVDTMIESLSKLGFIKDRKLVRSDSMKIMR